MQKGIILIFIAVIALVSTFFYLTTKDRPVIGNQAVLSEIDHLLLPVSMDTATIENFTHLKELVHGDNYARDEVNELIVLTRYKEYSHIGHGLLFLHDYVKTGKHPVCPGHALAHYFVFEKHGEIELAEQSIEEARTSFGTWNGNVTDRNLIQNALDRVDRGNRTSSEDEIATLSDIQCA